MKLWHFLLVVTLIGALAGSLWRAEYWREQSRRWAAIEGMQSYIAEYERCESQIAERGAYADRRLDQTNAERRAELERCEQDLDRLDRVLHGEAPVHEAALEATKQARHAEKMQRMIDEHRAWIRGGDDNGVKPKDDPYPQFTPPWPQHAIDRVQACPSLGGSDWFDDMRVEVDDVCIQPKIVWTKTDLAALDFSAEQDITVFVAFTGSSCNIHVETPQRAKAFPCEREHQWQQHQPALLKILQRIETAPVRIPVQIEITP